VRDKFIIYSSYDAKGTHGLYTALEARDRRGPLSCR
jgi:hypothetical protein